jgi:hypothetical protein
MPEEDLYDTALELVATLTNYHRLRWVHVGATAETARPVVRRDDRLEFHEAQICMLVDDLTPIASLVSDDGFDETWADVVACARQRSGAKRDFPRAIKAADRLARSLAKSREGASLHDLMEEFEMVVRFAVASILFTPGDKKKFGHDMIEVMQNKQAGKVHGWLRHGGLEATVDSHNALILDAPPGLLARATDVGAAANRWFSKGIEFCFLDTREGNRPYCGFDLSCKASKFDQASFEKWKDDARQLQFDVGHLEGVIELRRLKGGASAGADDVQTQRRPVRSDEDGNGNGAQTAPPEDAPHPDGPDQGRTLWWKNEPHVMPPKIADVIKFMWDRSFATYDDFKDGVWGHDNSTTDNTVRSKVSLANTWLIDNHIDPGWDLSAAGAVVSKRRR